MNAFEVIIKKIETYLSLPSSGVFLNVVFFTDGLIRLFNTLSDPGLGETKLLKLLPFEGTVGDFTLCIAIEIEDDVLVDEKFAEEMQLPLDTANEELVGAVSVEVMAKIDK